MKIIYGSQLEQYNDDIIILKKEDLYIPSEIVLIEKANLALNEIENKIVKNKKISHLFSHDDFSLWWFIYPSIFLSLKEAIKFIEFFENIIKNKKPSVIQIDSDFDKLPIIRQICMKYHIKISYSVFNYLKFLIRRWFIKKIQPFRYKQITDRKINSRLELFKKNHKSLPSITNKVLFAVATAYRRKIFDPFKCQAVNNEFLVNPLLEIIKTLNFDQVGIDLDYTFKGQLDILSERLNEIIPWFPIELISDHNFFNSKSKYALKTYQKVIKDIDFQMIFQINNINFWSLMENDFEKLQYAPSLPFYTELVYSLTNFFKENKPRAIFIPYEVGPIALAIILACNRNGIKTIGYQHGLINGLNPDYSHHDFRSEKNPYGMPLPDFLLLFGNFTKRKILEQGTYPKEKLIVFGHSMYFELDKILQSLKNTNPRKKFGISDEKKVILFTTGRFQKYYQGFETQNHDEKIFQKLLKEYAKDENYLVIIKPHPTEDNMNYYNEQISKNNCKNFVIMRDDLFELLFLADVVICYFSTVLIDSVTLSKKTIQVVLGESDFGIPFKEYGVIIISDLDSLNTNISKLLSDSNFQQSLMNKREDFVKDQFNIPNEDPSKQIESLLR